MKGSRVAVGSRIRVFEQKHKGVGGLIEGIDDEATLNHDRCQVCTQGIATQKCHTGRDSL